MVVSGLDPWNLEAEILPDPAPRCGEPFPTARPGRLDLCLEYTKPTYLRIRSLGTLQNHRSPPG